MDNLAAYKIADMAEAIRAAGAKLKALLRKAVARTREALWTTIGRLIDTLSPGRVQKLPRKLRIRFD